MQSKNLIEETKKEELELDKMFSQVKTWVITVVGALILTYTIFFYDRGLIDQGAFGAFGDYIGGLLNPTLTFITILILIKTMRIQTKELALTRAEYKETREEIRAGNEARELAAKNESENLNEQKKQFAIEALVPRIGKKVEVATSILISKRITPQMLTPRDRFSLPGTLDVISNANEQYREQIIDQIPSHRGLCKIYNHNLGSALVEVNEYLTEIIGALEYLKKIEVNPLYLPDDNLRDFAHTVLRILDGIGWYIALLDEGNDAKSAYKKLKRSSKSLLFAFESEQRIANIPDFDKAS